MSYFTQSISEYVWDTKYRYKQKNYIYDVSIEDTWQRVARAASHPEKATERKYWTKRFYHLLENFVFLPGGRILAGAGTSRSVTLFNCYVMKISEDSLTNIFDALKEGALTLQQGGGIGYDFSILRPCGYQCSKTDSIASGPVSFMRIWDAMSATMVSSGSRRGAMMANLRCDHPDIFQFIDIKANPHELRHFNLSVIVTDEFMQAVKKNDDWQLVFPSHKKNNNSIMRRWSGNRELVPCDVVKIIKARDLWQHIIECAYHYAEPGVIFEDTINNYNPLEYCEWISATNPCGEIPLPFYGACNLGSINLTQFVRNSFSSNAYIDWHYLEEVTELATRFLDNIIEMSHYPLPPQKAAAKSTRRIGLGFTGLADTFVMLNMKYGEKESLELATEISKKISYTTWLSSAKLGKDKGSFPLFKKKYLESLFVSSLPSEVRNEIKKLGMRNSHHNAIAPTGSISLLANNISGGIEPIFSSIYEREIRDTDNKKIKFKIEDYAYHYYKKKYQKDGLPPAWKEIKLLTPQEHLAIQGVVQPFIDNAISKTINLPVEFPLSDLLEIYQHAYDLKLKGCTIFRPNPITGSVMTTDDIDPCCSSKQC